MYQCGPEWHILQCQTISEVSDLIILNEWSQVLVPGTAILAFECKPHRDKHRERERESWRERERKNNRI